jgi:allantoinase
MSSLAQAIVGGQIVTEQGTFAADIGVDQGTIVQVTVPGQLSPAEVTLDATGLLVMPGAIDIHWHCRAPAYPERGDFATETRAAAAGGVTTVFEMPISKPGCATSEILRSRRALGQKDSYVNFGLFCSPGLLDRADILAMAAEGAIGFKIFMHPPHPGREDEFQGLCITDEGDLYQALAMVKETGLHCTIHSESPQLLEYFSASMKRTGRKDPLAHADGRPPVIEASAIATLTVLADALRVPIHIAHLSTQSGLTLIREAQARGVPITAETCPQYLFFDEQDMHRLGPYAKINPPLRARTDVDALWQGIYDGTISAVTTDHSPFLVEEKERGWADIWAAVSGAPGVETFVPVMMDAAASGRLSVPQVVKLVSANPARLFRLYPQKGVIQAGSDADLILVDPRAEWTVDPELMFSRSRYTDKFYAGRRLKGRVMSTMVGGRLVYHQGKIVGQQGGGAFVRPGPAPSVPVPEH